MVLADRQLQDRLRTVPDKIEFTDLVVTLARDHGCEMTGEDVAEAMRAGKRSWIERWI